MNFEEYKKMENDRYEERVRRQSECAKSATAEVWDFIKNIEQYISKAIEIDYFGKLSDWEDIHHTLELTMPDGVSYRVQFNGLFHNELWSFPIDFNKYIKGVPVRYKSIAREELYKSNPANLKGEEFLVFKKYVRTLVEKRKEEMKNEQRTEQYHINNIIINGNRAGLLFVMIDKATMNVDEVSINSCGDLVVKQKGQVLLTKDEVERANVNLLFDGKLEVKDLKTGKTVTLTVFEECKADTKMRGYYHFL